MQLLPERMINDLETSDQQAGKPEIRAGISQHVLDIFWGLSSTQEDERAKNSLMLLSTLQQQQPKKKKNKKEEKMDSGDAEDMNPNTLLQYTLKRLITGLSSNRQAASLGFATALCEVLAAHGHCISLAELLDLINENLQTSKQDNKNQRTHTCLGKLLAFTSLIRSGVMGKATAEEIKRMVSSLSKIRSRFPMLSAVSTECINQLCSCELSVTVDELKFILLEQLLEELTVGWEKCTADTCQLLLLLHEKKLVDEEFLLEHWEHRVLVGSKSLSHLAAVMIQSTCHSPVIHNVNMNIVQKAAAHGQKLFNKLWTDVIIGRVYNVDKPARCYLVYQLIPETLRSLCKPRSISTILCPELIGPLMKQMTHRDAYLHKAAVKLMSDIVGVVRDAADSAVQLQILRCLLSEPSSYMFDSITSTRTLSNIISHLNSAAATELSQELMNVISADSPLCGRRGEGIVPWCANTLAHMLTLNSMTAESAGQSWRTDILKFLMVDSCFIITSPCDSLDHCQQVPSLTNADRLSIKDSLLKGLSVLSTYQSGPRGSGGKQANIDYNNILHSLFKYTGDLLDNKDSIEAFHAISEEELLLWSELKKNSKQIQKCQKEAADDKANIAMYSAFQLMLELFALHLFIVDQSERGELIDTIKEIQVCFHKAVGRKKSKEELSWCDVITEVLISLMSKSSLLLRSVSTSVFTKILPMVNVTAIQLILDVFQSEDNEFDADNESAEDEDMMSPEEADAEEDSSSSMSSDESSDEEEEENSEEVDENLRATVQAALGSAADVDSDQESEKDLSDDEMCKLDNALSEAFKAMRRKNKNSPEELQKRREIKHFKLRCLDLVDVVVKHSSRGEFLMELVVPIMTLIEAGYKDKEMKDIGKKAQTIHSHLTSLKKLPTCSVKDKDDVSEKISELLSVSTNAYVWPIMKEISASLNLMVKLLSHSEYTGTKKSKRKDQKTSGDSLVELVTDKVQAALREFLTKRESRYSHTLFMDLFDRQHVLFWSCSADLVKAISSSDTRIFCRTQACALLLHLLHKDIRSEVGDSVWQEFCDALVTSAAQVAVYSAENYKPGFLLEFFSMLQRARTVDKNLVVDVSSFECNKFNKDLMKLYKRVAAPPASPLKPSAKKRKTSTSSIEAAPTVQAVGGKKRK